MTRLSTLLGGVVLLVTACSSAPAGTLGPTPLGGAVGAQLCDAQNPAGLPAVVAQLEALQEADDPGPLLTTLGTTLGLIGQLSLEPSSDLASWRDASVDAIQQFQQRISEPDRREALVSHAALTLGLFEDRLCP